ncbi:N-acetyltransferase [Arthrobacter echini]|uniref:N-acetyltransferase n=1 Tax=Arthrobacter echini TaxID=1529066 RepID=A0A4V3Z5L1_9MICC|nr:GNAT family N-acetyltransferase [Arthrobacter echini]THJ66759.1 N-acetyltransferase [Arthrobacter echini]
MTSQGTEESGTSDVSVTNDEAGQQYTASLDGESVGTAAYERSGDSIVFTHTVVEPAAEGRGVGSALVRHALDEAREQQLTVVPKCQFVAAYIERHPEYQDLTN